MISQKTQLTVIEHSVTDTITDTGKRGGQCRGYLYLARPALQRGEQEAGRA